MLTRRAAKTRIVRHFQQNILNGRSQKLKPQTLRAIAIVLVLVSASISLLKIQGVINWDLGIGRWPILIIAVGLLLAARRKEK